MNLQGKKINFLGDSITEGCGVENQDNRFDNRIAAQYGALVRNYGIGGTRIARQTTPSSDALWDKDFLSRVPEMDPDADIVVVFGGTNDYGHGDAPLGAPDSRDVFTFCGALNLLCEALMEKYPAAAIVVCTPLHRLFEASVRNDFGVRNQTDLAGYCELIRQRAAYYSLPVLDLYSQSGLQPAIETLHQLYMPDGLHPNDVGHERLAQKMGAFLSAL